MEDDKKRIVYWINKNEQYILDILQLDSVISGKTLYTAPSLSDLLQSFILYSYIMEINYENIREKMRNNLSNNLKIPLIQKNKESQNKKYLIKSLRVFPYTLPLSEEKILKFNNQRVIAVNFKGFNYKIIRFLLEDLTDEKNFQGEQYALIKSIFQLFISDNPFL